MTVRYGITVAFEDRPLREQRRRYESLADLGYTDVWSTEADSIDAITPLALAAAWAPQLRIGTSVVPAQTRGPLVIAQTIAALAEATTGGVAVGIGASSAAIVERWNGVVYDSPYARVRDVARFLRQAFRGEKVSEAYETFRVDGARLARPPADPPPVLIAALRPAMMRLAGREADGVILNWLSARDVACSVAPELRASPPMEVAARILVAPIDDPERVRAISRRLIAGYLTTPGYAAAQEWMGRGEELAPVVKAWGDGDRKAALEAISDRLVDDLVLHGPPERCREMVDAYVDAGVTTPIVALLPFGYDVDAALRGMAPAR